MKQISLPPKNIKTPTVLHFLVYLFVFFGCAGEGIWDLPDQGWNLGPLQRKHGILTAGSPAKYKVFLFVLTA